MPNIQTSFNVSAVVSTPGRIYDQRPTQSETKFAAAVINFGTFCAQSTSPAAGIDQTANPSATGDVTAHPHGVAMYDETAENSAVQSGGVGYTLNRPVHVMRRGLIWVVAETDVAIVVGSACFVRFVANGAGKLQLGAFRADNDGGNAVAVPNGACVFRAGFTAGTLALVEINLP